MRSLAFFLLALSLLAFACTPPEYSAKRKKADPGSVNFDLHDLNVQRLYNLRDERRTDSLLLYLQSKEATLRYLAALSFASSRDSLGIDALVPLLQDGVEEVRIAAAFSLGQIGKPRCEKILTEAFDAHDSLSLRQRYNSVVLEAIGKCGTAASLKHIATVTTYQPTDTLLLEGQCRAIYRFGTRGISDPEGTARMVAYVADVHIPERVRLVAAHYLARAKNVAVDSAQAIQVAAAFVRSTDPDTRMALATALGKSTTGPAFAMLSKVIAREADWRVRCNIINALANWPNYDTVRALVSPLILDPNPHVSRTAAEFFINKGQVKDGDYYWRIAKDNPNLPWQSQVALYRASNKWLSGKAEPESKDFVNYRLREIFQQSKNTYERAACLEALSEFGWQYRYIHDRGFTDRDPAVRTAAAQGILNILKRPNFYGFFGEASKGVRRELYYYLREIVGSGDVGMISTAAEGFREPALNFKTMRDSARISDFQGALNKMNLPRDYEAYEALAKTLAWFEGQPEPAKIKPAFNHPIDWTLLEKINPATRATVKTSKGDFVLEFYPQWAPGSVANFMQLTATGFYEGKSFHRVVPNFVVQGGCPRGDGSGALDYSIRTENGLAWYDDEGYLGMASAGPDTEGTQFFITHSPTPHLDGNYTIFGKVVQGMEVVHQLQVGDKIEKVVIQ